MEKDYYVLLTGSKTNSGDHLIKNSAIELFKHLRPDRGIIDMNGWEYLSEEKLEVVNKSKALILLGGPALRTDTYPTVYPLRHNLDDITVPITMLGIGFRSINTDYDSYKKFHFSDDTKKLLSRINNNKFKSSVRDFYTLNALLNNGYANFALSGCPAMYNLDYISKKFIVKEKINNIAFAAGRGYLRHEVFFTQQIELIIKLQEYFKQENFTVAFHDPIDLNNKKTAKLISSLENKNIKYIDISTTDDNLRKFYETVDLQIGLRVHAHIYMCSINKPSILINEDSRGIGIRTVLQGLVFDAYKFKPISFIDRVKSKLSISLGKSILTISDLFDDIIFNYENELLNNYTRMKATRKLIDHYYEDYKNLINSLP